MQVQEVLKLKGSTLFSVTPESQLSDAVVSMADNDIGSVVVMEGGRLAGMLLREVAARPHLRDLLAHEPEGGPIAVADHCYGCTAGQGSSCGGALAEAA